MVKNPIKVYARIKKETISKKNKLENYIISSSGEDYDDLIFHQNTNDVRFSYYQFRYHKVFDQLSPQNEIFETVAEPVVNSVIHGFNGTIFAYGQTGSGKTYSITGCPKIYENRGIIPRCIEHIFEYLNKNPDAYTIHLSYLEIYNEIGYDLLNPKQIASRLEEFPRVILLEDGKGEAHLRNLSVHAVSTEKEAMRLVFLGDTNRTIAETPMNYYSSRSHCIFTIYLTSLSKRNNKTVKSKLHIVDLAGSERISKSSITGSILNEAKNINLSLHYLEQVISALSSSKKHIPFRNSMLTYLLKDSLCGNSLTTMLATLAVTRKNIEETISTCKFSKRVSMIKTQPKINEEEFDSHQEINMLQNEICELKTKLSKYEDGQKLNFKDPYFESENKFDDHNREHFTSTVERFLNYKVNVIDLTLSEMKYCMEIMREMCQNKTPLQIVKSSNFHMKPTTREKQINTPHFDLKKEETEFLPSRMNELSVDIEDKNDTNIHNKVDYIKSSHCKERYTGEIEEYHNRLQQTYEEAKSMADTIEQCRQNIIILRTKMDDHRNSRIREQLIAELYRQQDHYRNTILKLRHLEKKTNHLKCGLLQAEMKRRRSSSVDLNQDNISSNDSIGHNSGDRYNSFASFDHLASYSNRSSNRLVEAQHDHDDYNRPEKETDGTQILLTSCDRIIPTSSPEHIEHLPTFLQLLADEDCGLAKEQLGLSPEEEEPLKTDWYPEYCRNNIVSPPVPKKKQIEKNHKVKRREGRPMKENEQNCASRNTTNRNRGLVRNSQNRQILHDLESSEPNEIFSGKLTDWDSQLPTQEQREKLQQVPRKSSKNCNAAEIPQKIDKSIAHFKETDSVQFKEFMKTIPLTGDKDVDEEILNFYRSKFKN